MLFRSTVIVRTSGGGGWGDPLDREAERVQSDAMDGLVTLDAARDFYGVILDAKTFAVDARRPRRSAPSCARRCARTIKNCPSASLKRRRSSLLASASRMPTLFVGHGTPMNAILDNQWTQAFRNLANEVPRPKAIVSISGHFYTPGIYEIGRAHV